MMHDRGRGGGRARKPAKVAGGADFVALPEADAAEEDEEAAKPPRKRKRAAEESDASEFAPSDSEDEQDDDDEEDEGAPCLLRELELSAIGL